MNSKIRILLMIHEASIGGGQQHVLWLAERLDRARFEVLSHVVRRDILSMNFTREIPVFLRWDVQSPGPVID
jgi:hypothetical protein